MLSAPCCMRYVPKNVAGPIYQRDKQPPRIAAARRVAAHSTAQPQEGRWVGAGSGMAKAMAGMKSFQSGENEIEGRTVAGAERYCEHAFPHQPATGGFDNHSRIERAKLLRHTLLPQPAWCLSSDCW